MALDVGSTIAIVMASIAFTPVAITGMVLRHREKMAALRNRQEGAPRLVEEVSALRHELSSLRETTTKFDMSFDAALHRVEERLHTVETQSQPVDHYRAPAANAAVETETILRSR